MAFYEAPPPNRPFSDDFVRLRNVLLVKGEAAISHINLVREHGLLDDFLELRRTNPLEIDAGRIDVAEPYLDELVVDAGSGTLASPVVIEGRYKSVVIFQDHTPHHHVIAGVRKHIYSVDEFIEV